MAQEIIRILMIDDDEDDFLIVKNMVRDTVDSKYIFEWSSSYTDGLEKVNKKMHDVYLVDYRIGPNTGLDLIKEAVKQGCQAPLIILTGQSDYDIDTLAMKAGASDYIVKGSISGEILSRSIRYAIENARQANELKTLNAELEDRVEKRTLALEETLRELENSQKNLLVAKMAAEQAAERAEAAARSKQQFLSNMSHEIRTPMNAIIGFTNIVLKTDLDREQKECLDAIKVAGDALIVLINDILDLAKVDAGKMTFEEAPFNLPDKISATLHLFKIKLMEKNISLVTDFDKAIPEIVKGDSTRLQQIILNLVNNAVKFTPAGKIDVSIKLAHEDSESVKVRFSITDTGIGIKKEKLDHIFENFSQESEDTSRLYGGTGLGLAIVKQMVTLQNGTLDVKSEVGKGSCFSFELNFKKASKRDLAPSAKTNGAEPVETLSAKTGKENGIRVLVAEDNPLSQLLMKTLLKSFGFERDIVANGKMAIDKLKNNKYDIILMDLRMPEMNGFETTEYIRKEMHSTIPIIALTADVSTDDVEKCREVGMNDYISKPVQEKALHHKIMENINKQQLSDARL